MDKFNKFKKTRTINRKGYYVALGICLVMVGIACFCAYRQATGKMSQQLESISERPAVTTQQKNDKKAVGVAEKKEGIKKETTPAVTTAPPQTTTAKKTEGPKSDSYSRSFSIPINGEIIQDFSGDELVKNQTTGAWQTHNGVDISGSEGDEVHAMTDGTVTDVSESPLWGVIVEIDHGDGITGRYCNLNKGVTVEKGTKVSSGDVIGALGNTADIESGMDSHLHFEIIKNKKYVNPIDIINNKG